MPELKPRQLGTSRDTAPVSWVIHQTGSFLTGELFAGAYYRDCLRIAEAMAGEHRPAVEAVHAQRKSKVVDPNRLAAHLEDVSRWAREVREEDYHTVNTSVLISLWAAQEAGLENTVAAILQTDRQASIIASAKFAAGRFQIDNWPWPESTCVEIAQRLDAKAKDSTPNGGADVCQRLVTLLGWFGLKLDLDVAKAQTYNEASVVRNIVLHRYGVPSPRDIENFAGLAPWAGVVIPITSARLNAYHSAVVSVFMSVAQAVWAGGHK